PEVQAHGRRAPRHGGDRADRGRGAEEATPGGRRAGGDGSRVPDERQGRPRQHPPAVPRLRRAVRVLPAEGRGEGEAGARAGMSLEPEGYIDLPPHAREGGFDHAAVHAASARLYVAHTANDAVDVIDTRENRYVRTISGLREVAGALVSDARDVVFTSNRGDDTVAVFPEGDDAKLAKIKVGVRPNGLAFDPTRNLLLAANVGD